MICNECGSTTAAFWSFWTMSVCYIGRSKQLRIITDYWRTFHKHTVRVHNHINYCFKVIQKKERKDEISMSICFYFFVCHKNTQRDIFGNAVAIYPRIFIINFFSISNWNLCEPEIQTNAKKKILKPSRLNKGQLIC